MRVMKNRSSREELRRSVAGARAALGLSQIDLAKKAGLSRPVISMLEQGRANPTLAVLDKLSAALGCSTCELLARRSRKASRFSRSGRKPSLSNWLSNPPPGSKTAAARDFGVDLTLLSTNLRLSPEKRLEKLAQGAAALMWLRRAQRANGTPK